jgi:hypothetical protein
MTLTVMDLLAGFVAIGKRPSDGSFDGSGFSASTEALPSTDLEFIRGIHELVMPKQYNFLSQVRPVAMIDSAVCTLRSGRRIEGATFAYAIDLPHDYAGIVFRYHIHEQTTVDELIEIAALMRTAADHVDPEKAECCVIESPGRVVPIGRWLEQFMGITECEVIPLLYIRQFRPWVETAEELARRFGPEITALLNLWDQRTSFLKPQFVERELSRDSHPFTFGMTFISPVCTIELHPKGVEKAAKIRGRSVEEHHLREWTFLATTVVIAGLQRRVLQDDAEALDILLSQAGGGKPIGRWQAWNFFKELQNLRGLSQRRAGILARLDVYYNTWSTAREYLDESLIDARRRFRIDDVHRAVQDRLNELNDDISLRLTAQISILGFWVAVSAAGLGLVAAIAALISL